jgi:hypothetical protein
MTAARSEVSSAQAPKELQWAEQKEVGARAVLHLRRVEFDNARRDYNRKRDEYYAALKAHVEAMQEPLALTGKEQ